MRKGEGCLLARLAAIVTRGDSPALEAILDRCRAAATDGTEVRVFFRDESIPLVCHPEITERLGAASNPAILRALSSLADAGDVRLYACSSSLYLWGVSWTDLIPALRGARGLVAFLVDDLAGATEVLSL